MFSKLSNATRNALAGAAALGATVAAHATSGSDAVTAITAAQTDTMLVVGGLTAFGIAVWGGMVIYRKFFK